MNQEKQQISFENWNKDNPDHVELAFRMRRLMFVANDDPEDRFDHIWPDAMAHAAFLATLSIVQFITCDDEKVGLFSLEYGGKKNKDGGYVDMLFFEEQFRGKGFGRIALEHIRDLCRQKNYFSLVLHSKKANETNVNIYSKLGFTCLGDVDDTGFLLKWRMEI